MSLYEGNHPGYNFPNNINNILDNYNAKPWFDCSHILLPVVYRRKFKAKLISCVNNLKLLIYYRHIFIFSCF